MNKLDEIRARADHHQATCPSCDRYPDDPGEDCLCSSIKDAGKQLVAEDVPWLLARLEKAEALLRLQMRGAQFGPTGCTVGCGRSSWRNHSEDCLTRAYFAEVDK